MWPVLVLNPQPLGFEPDTVPLCQEGHNNYHQFKIQNHYKEKFKKIPGPNANPRAWTIAKLANASVLSASVVD